MEEKELTKEQLQEALNKAQMQINFMHKNIQELNMNNLFMRLKYLFKVMKYPNAFSKEFYEACAKEIETLITIPKEEENE